MTPNVRRLVIADPGMIICEADLVAADAQVVAWEAGDTALMEFFTTPQTRKLHEITAEVMFGTVTPATYDKAKRMVHATDYGVSARTLAIKMGITVHEADQFQRRWFGMHPGIKCWQERILAQLKKTRMVKNAFGYRRVYTGRVESDYKAALAWVPQSTVGLVIAKGQMQVEKWLPAVEVLLQEHDSLVMQFPACLKGTLVPQIREKMDILVPYRRPLRIPVEIKVGPSWGELV